VARRAVPRGAGVEAGLDGRDGGNEPGAADTAARRTIDYRGTPVVLCGPRGDRYFATVDLNPHGNAALYWVAQNAVAPDAVVMDVGANIGLTASVFARHTEGAVYAVEPSPLIFPHLEATVAANGAAQVRPLNVALGSAPGRMRFYADRTAAAASHLVTDATLARRSDIEVPVTTLDALVTLHGIDRLDLVKLDVEGFELDVLDGARQTLERLAPAVFLEFNAFTMIAFRNLNPREFLDTLRARFPYLYRFRDGAPRRVETDQHVIGFLHDVLVGPGCVDDLLCTFRPR